MILLNPVTCKEKIKVLPVEIRENDYKTAVQNNTRKEYGDKFSKYGYIYANSIVLYNISKFATQHSQTQITALLFEVQFLAHTIYPVYNVPIDCKILNRKQGKGKINILILQPIVELNVITKKIFNKNPIYIEVDLQQEEVYDNKKYQINDVVKAYIYEGYPWYMQEEQYQYHYKCYGNIGTTETNQQTKIVSNEEKYILKDIKKQKGKKTVETVIEDQEIENLQSLDRGQSLTLSEMALEVNSESESDVKNDEKSQKESIEELCTSDEINSNMEEEEQEEDEEDELNDYDILDEVEEEEEEQIETRSNEKEEEIDQDYSLE